MAITYVKSAFNGLQIGHDGYLYTKDRVYGEVTYWKCICYNKFKCKGRLHTANDEITEVINEHNHEKCHGDITAKRLMAKIKERASSSTNTPQQIIGEIAENVSMTVAGKLPKVNLVKRTIQRARKRTNNAPTYPRTLEEMIIPERYKKTAKRDDFLFYDSGAGPERILIFATNKSIDLLSKSAHWYADGTFKTSPLLFAQIYTIHGIYQDEIVFAVYALLPNQQESTYAMLFAALKAKAPALNPATILTDFEIAAQNAFRSIFPNAIIRACFFHFCQAIYRKIQSHKEILDMYENEEDEDNSLQLRQIAALAFVPEDDVMSSFYTLLESDFFTTNEECLLPLIDYFETTWIGRSIGGSNRRRPARFPIELWNCYYASLEGLPKTNNSIEGWHNAFHSLISADHPTVWTCIDGFKRDNSINELKIEQSVAGNEHSPKKIYKDTAARIKSIVADYDNRNLLDYLRGIAHNFKLQKS